MPRPGRDPAGAVVHHQTPSTGHHGILRGHVITAVAVMRQRLAEPWTLNSLADEVHLSRSQLMRAFDATVGMSPMAYLRQMRLERTARLLVSTDLSIAAAARSVGSWTLDRNLPHGFRTRRAADLAAEVLRSIEDSEAIGRHVFLAA